MDSENSKPNSIIIFCKLNKKKLIVTFVTHEKKKIFFKELYANKCTFTF